MKPSGLPFHEYEARNKAAVDAATVEINVMFGGFPGPVPKRKPFVLRGEGSGDNGFYDRKSSNHWSRQNAEFRKKRLGL